jgi:DNA-damage-inducible protein J
MDDKKQYDGSIKGGVIMQMAKKEVVTITIRMDAELKKQAEALFEDIGLNMTSAFTIFTKAAVRAWGIPFEVKGDPFWSEENQAELRRRIEDMDAGRNVHEHDWSEIDHA